jgi:hypothetical protein
MMKFVDSSTGAPRRPKTNEKPRQMAIYVIKCGENHNQVDTNCLCVEMLIRMPKPMNIDMIAVPP